MKSTSLRARLLVPTLTASVLVMLAAAAAGAALMVRHLTESFQLQAAHTVEFVATVGAPYITNYDLTALGLFVRELARDKQVAFAEFFDADGKSLTSDVMTAPKDATGLLLVEREVKDSTGKKVGSLRAGFRDSAVVVARNLVLVAIGGGMLAVLAVIVGLQLWAVRFVMRTIGAEPTEAVAVADGIADGDLMRNVAVAGGDNASLLAALSRMQKQLRRIVEDIRSSAASIQVSSAEIAQGHTDLSTRTEEQASSLEQTAASMEQMTATVAQNADNARKASEFAGGASEVAARGGQAVGEVVSTMAGISESSKKIADIIGVIDGIAFQTNILALNAAVEAARAGEQGRGFAVVASEVRSLAQRSAEAAKEIRQLIAESVARVDAGTQQVAQAGNTIAEVVSSVKDVNNLVAEISAASQEQSQGIAQVSDTVQQLEKVTQQNAAMVEEATAAAGSLEEQAALLIKAIGTFKLADQGWVAVPARAAKAAAPVAAVKAAPKAAAPKAAPKAVALSKHAPKEPALERKPAAKRAAAGGGKAEVEGWEEF